MLIYLRSSIFVVLAACFVASEAQDITSAVLIFDAIVRGFRDPGFLHHLDDCFKVNCVVQPGLDQGFGPGRDRYVPSPNWVED